MPVWHGIGRDGHRRAGKTGVQSTPQLAGRPLEAEEEKRKRGGEGVEEVDSQNDWPVGVEGAPRVEKKKRASKRRGSLSSEPGSLSIDHAETGMYGNAPSTPHPAWRAPMFFSH